MTGFDIQTDPNKIKYIVDTLYPLKTHINQQNDPRMNDELMHLIIEKKCPATPS